MFLLCFVPSQTCVAVRRNITEPKLTDGQTFMMHYAEAELPCQVPSKRETWRRAVIITGSGAVDNMTFTLQAATSKTNTVIFIQAAFTNNNDEASF